MLRRRTDPTTAPRTGFQRVVLPVLLCAAALFPAASPGQKAVDPPPEPLDPVVAEARGQALVADLLARSPDRELDRVAALKVRAPGKSWRETGLRVLVQPGAHHWTTIYEAQPSDLTPGGSKLTVTFCPGHANSYQLLEPATAGAEPRRLAGDDTMIPFAGSDFWVADLGLEFFHWPKQKLLRTEMRRGQSCNVLESTNPNPAPEAYSRVESWIDIDTGGIVRADAYDLSNRSVKRFSPKSFEKVQGEWQVEEMEIRNTRTGSTSVIKFHYPGS